MARSKTQLPRRFVPYLSQAQTEAAIRYGQPEEQLASLLQSTLHSAGNQLAAADTANREVIGSLRAGGGLLDAAYANAGLTPQVLQSIASTPGGARIASELAAAHAQNLQQTQGAKAGAVYQRQHILDQLHQDVGQINSQASSLARERGLFTSGLLDQLISSDRATRHAANMELKKEQFQASQNEADRLNSTINTLLGQGIQASVGKNGQIQIGPPIRGGKADPNSPQNRQKNRGPKATPGEQSAAESDFGSSLDLARQMAHRGGRLQDIVKGLAKGSPARPGKPVYEDVPTYNQFGQKTGTKRQAKLDPKTGTVVTVGGQDAIPGIDAAIAQAVAEQAVNGFVSSRTIKHLHHLGYRVLDFPHLVTEHQARQMGTGGYSSGPPPSPYDSGAPYSVMGPK